jgi:hypothetical protein
LRRVFLFIEIFRCLTLFEQISVKINLCFFLYDIQIVTQLKLNRHTGISLGENFFYSSSEFQIHKILVRTGILRSIGKIRVPELAPDLELDRDQKQVPDLEQALDLELATEGPIYLDHLRKIKVPAPDPELAPVPELALDTELVPDPELAPSPDPTMIWLVIIGTWFSITSHRP